MKKVFITMLLWVAVMMTASAQPARHEIKVGNFTRLVVTDNVNVNIFDSGVTRAAVESAKVEVERLKLALNADLDSAHEDVQWFSNFVLQM